MNQVEILYLDVNKLIEQNDLSKAYVLLYEILSIDPGYARAHNYLGWIYEIQFKDFAKAKRHYELAIKFSPEDFPASYVNYVYLLLRFNELVEAEVMINRALSIPGVDYATLFYQKGRIMEDRFRFRKAYFYFRSAKMRANDADFIRMMDLEMDRIRHKMSSLGKIISLISVFFKLKD
ncbi:hypothetical protein [Weeksella virosa]|uniref:Uncharacterized protein n=1 Tax=Weeksella virosa (strain ATCC 43766 / DSM 16922 / JCM 21250 / CCUG 30538 / CDC 9751 / IAM 14551 / NBRC 16016 / NCTC 11634 / CL345/78) TaxID=865938 RepID=F0P1A7_WEEVC|nr:hypothetical protein [Weeksella virosa]ADX68621.1 hypothetical protein Weevi_1937 [Weeksella virosa DSM 16922]MDK7375846.1 hypothetical protein [Weeksella virosa]MDK7676273.1 hypothetical protein [Weeksella virosa]SUP54962.1 Predicted O-linked N-acetylglucosamine transferase, SPINDLY family [Weeksella virosa]VEH63715.1 Predicted O-linked N-acetylglucosamine transferase, SPINDLY family [Weeksella virosa]